MVPLRSRGRRGRGAALHLPELLEEARPRVRAQGALPAHRGVVPLERLLPAVVRHLRGCDASHDRIRLRRRVGVAAAVQDPHEISPTVDGLGNIDLGPKPVLQLPLLVF